MSIDVQESFARRGFCSAKNPNDGTLTAVCVKAKGHSETEHCDPFNGKWTEASEFEEVRGEREDRLRQLLSYCRQEAGSDPGCSRCGVTPFAKAYDDVADRLANILDGEQ